jgi:REP element-mobilizing transposase RayT
MTSACVSTSQTIVPAAQPLYHALQALAPRVTAGSCYQTCPHQIRSKERLAEGRRAHHGDEMPSPPRDISPGLHHVWVNATGNWEYFMDDVDRVSWIRLFLRACRRHGWRPVAFCQMTTHVHAIVETLDVSLPLGMEFLNREYGKTFNALHQRYGALVRKRYGSRRIQGWSSYATTIGLSRDFPFVEARCVLDELGGSTASLRAFVEERAAERAGFGHGR